MRTPIAPARVTGATLLVLLGSGVLTGCKEDEVLTPPPPPQDSKATLVLSTITTGQSPDADGYMVVLDGVNWAIMASNEEREYLLTPGTHGIRLAGLEANCASADTASFTISAGSGQRLAHAFQVQCPTLATVAVVIATTGTALPSGYVLSQDGVALRSVGISEQLELSGVWPGQVTFRLSGVPGNCSITGDRDVNLFLEEGQEESIHYEVHCDPRTDDSPGEKLLLSSRPSVGTDANLEIMNADGSGRQRVTDDARDEMVPDFSSDGNSILFVRSSPVTAEQLVRLERSSRQEAVLGTLRVARAVWSPDGSHIAFVRDGRIYTMNADGSGEQQLTAGPNDRDPYWSPDGAKLAFSRFNDTYVIDAGGSGLHQLAASRLAGPWSPDGHRIVLTVMACVDDYYYYCYYGPSPTDLAVLDLDTGNELALTASPFTPEWSAAWSRDGTRIYYIGASNGSQDVYTVPSEGGTPVNLTFSAAREEWVTVGEIGAPLAAQRARLARPRRP